MEPFPQYRQLFQDATYSQEKSLEDCFFEYEVKLNKLAFEQQFQVRSRTCEWLTPQGSCRYGQQHLDQEETLT